MATLEEIEARIHEVQDEINRRYEAVDVSDLEEEMAELTARRDAMLDGIRAVEEWSDSVRRARALQATLNEMGVGSKP